MNRADAIGYDLIAAALLKAVVFPVLAGAAALYLAYVAYKRFGRGLPLTPQARRRTFLATALALSYALFELVA